MEDTSVATAAIIASFEAQVSLAVETAALALLTLGVSEPQIEHLLGLPVGALRPADTQVVEAA